MFLDFFYILRAHGLSIATQQWLSFLTALSQGLHGHSLTGFYAIARSLLVTSESQYDAFDQAFAVAFAGREANVEALLADLADWLKNPKILNHLDSELLQALKAMDFEELRRELQKRIQEQKERHEGGNYWIGTGGTSPFGQGGVNPAGIRIGEQGGGRSALAVAQQRRFREYRRDLILDTRQIAAALRKLRKLSRDQGDPELDIDETIDATARNCGDLEVVMRPPRRNNVRLLLFLDVGGSMDPHAHLVSRLFSAAHQGGTFRKLQSYYFHNCIYKQVYEDANFRIPVSTREILHNFNEQWFVIIVGDAFMHPGELRMTSGDLWEMQTGTSGFTWLAKIADRFPHSAWINPEPQQLWEAGTIAEIRTLFPMYTLTLAGLEELVVDLKRPADPLRRLRVHNFARQARER